MTAGGEAASPLVVRALTAADQAWARRYWRERWGSERIAVSDTVYEIAALAGFVAERDGEPVGVVTYLVTGDSCEIMTLDSVGQFQGTGTALVAAVKAEVTALGCRHLTVITTNDNLDALRFYQRRGFQLEAVDAGAVNRGRRLKPEIPLIGDYGIPIRDEIRLGMRLSGDEEQTG